jgi:hypothetical protein
MSIDSIALNMSSQNSQKVPTNIQQKKTNLFRCHSVKMKVPNKKIWKFCNYYELFYLLYYFIQNFYI